MRMRDRCMRSSQVFHSFRLSRVSSPSWRTAKVCSARLAASFCLTCRRSRERQARENGRRCVGAAASSCCAAESRTEAAPQFPEDSRVVRPASQSPLLVASSPLPQHDLLPLFYQKLFPCNDMIRYGGWAACCLRALFVLALPAHAALPAAGFHTGTTRGHPAQTPRSCRCASPARWCLVSLIWLPAIPAAPRVLLHAGERRLRALPVVQGQQRAARRADEEVRRSPEPGGSAEALSGVLPRLISAPFSTSTRRSAPHTHRWAATACSRPPSASWCLMWCALLHLFSSTA